MGLAGHRSGDGDSGVVLRALAGHSVKKTSVAPMLFGTDGVRGIAGQFPLEKSLIRKLGAAAAAIYRRNVVGRSPIFLAGRDTRASARWIIEAFAEGAASEQQCCCAMPA